MNKELLKGVSWVNSQKYKANKGAAYLKLGALVGSAWKFVKNGEIICPTGRRGEISQTG